MQIFLTDSEFIKMHLGFQLELHSPDFSVSLTAGEDSVGVPLRGADRLFCMSMTKPLIAALFMKAREEGLITFEESITKLLPEARGKENINWLHILTHAAGMRWFADHADSLFEDRFQKICAQSLESGWTAGEKAGYHLHSSWILLWKALERAFGRSAADVLKEKILLPLEMEKTGFGTHEGAVNNFYTAAPEGLSVHPVYQHFQKFPSDIVPGGGLKAPAADLVKFLQMLLHHGLFNGRRILQKESVLKLITPCRTGMFDQTFKKHVDFTAGLISNSADLNLWAYGFGKASAQAFGHGGMKSSQFWADPQTLTSCVIIFNAAPSDTAHEKRMKKFHEIVQSFYQSAPWREKGAEL